MPTEAQVVANKANAQHSTGPTTEAGKAKSCLNNFRSGFCGTFRVLGHEDQEEFNTLFAGLRAEHRPSTVTETLLVERMAQHFWLSKRAIRLQDSTLRDELTEDDRQRRFSLFLRYQTTNDRAFHKCLGDLLKLRAETRKAEIGFESKKRLQAQEARQEAAEKRKQERHAFDLLLAEARLDHQNLLNTELKYSIEADAADENPSTTVGKAA